jgi:hypothetical protein
METRMDTSDPVALSLRSNAIELRAVAETVPVDTAAHLYTVATELERLAVATEDAGRQYPYQWIL